MTLETLFQNLREWQIERSGDAAQPLIKRSLTPDYSISIDELWTDCFALQMQFGNDLEFADRKKCTPGKSFPCKSICLSSLKRCLHPLEGQARTYAKFLELHKGDKSKLVSATKAEAEAANKKTKKSKKQPKQPIKDKTVEQKLADLSQALGTTLKVEDFETDLIRSFVDDLSKIPIPLLIKAKEAGLNEIHLANKGVPDLNKNQHLTGVTPRGWDSSYTWNDVPGAYNPDHKAVVAGKGWHGSTSLILHEYMHGLGDVLGFDNHPELIQIHKEIYNQLNPYLQQEGPGGRAGRQELLAEGGATVLKAKDLAEKLYGKKFVDFIEKNVINA